MAKRILTLLIVLLLTYTTVGCGSGDPPTGTRLRIWSERRRNVSAKLQPFRIKVQLTFPTEQKVGPFAVVAEIFDAEPKSLGKLTCSALPDSREQYQSEFFKPPENAKKGDWKVVVTVGQKRTVTDTYTFLMAEEANPCNFILDVPTNWETKDDQCKADGGFVRFGPAVQGDERTLLEVRYQRGEVDVNAKAVQQALETFQPAGFEKGTTYVTHVLPIKVQGQPAWLARGGIMTEGRNFSVEILRFVCEQGQNKRTFTIIKASTSDAAMAQMSAILGTFGCHAAELG